MTAAASRSQWFGTGLVIIAAPTLVFGAVSASLVQRVADAATTFPTTYAATSTVAYLFDLAAGIGLLLAGILMFVTRPRVSLGRVTVFIGVAWLAADWVGWRNGPSFARSVALVAAPFALGLVVHLALAFPVGHVIGRLAGVFVGIVYGVAVIVAVIGAFVSDPILDQHCWSYCGHNSFLVHADVGAMRFLAGFWLRWSVGIGLLIWCVCISRLARATPVAREAMWPVLVPTALVAAADMSYAALLLRDPVEDPRRTIFGAVFLARALARCTLAVGITWAVVRAHRTRQSVARLADELGETPAPGSLQAVLVRSLGDDDLDVAYWRSDAHQYVDEAGQVVTPEPGPEQTTTAIVRQGRPVALIVHDRGLSIAHDLEREIGAAARLAVDNERLRAEMLAQVADLRASQARIVATGDATRRGLERDLHDGAQQRLLAASFELRLASAEAEIAGDATLVRLLASASHETQHALIDLRELAQGIFPAILTEAGLGPALWTLADHAGIPVEILDVLDEREAAATETAAYLVVAEAIIDAVRRSATHMTARVVHEADHLVVETNDDGTTPRIVDFANLSDRVGALGGRLDINANIVRAEIPCA